MTGDPGRSVERIARAGSLRAATDLQALRRLAERLDPVSIAKGEAPAAYLARCRAVAPEFRAVVERLRRERSELERDVRAFDADSSALAAERGRLAGILEGAFPGDPDGIAERARLAESFAVCEQGLLALAAARDGAHVLVAAIDRATGATVSAIRTAELMTRAVERRGAAFDLAAGLAAATGDDTRPVAAESADALVEDLGRAFAAVRTAAELGYQLG